MSFRLDERLNDVHFIVISGLNGGIDKLNLWKEVIEVINTWLVDGGSAHKIACLGFDEGSEKVLNDLVNNRVVLAFLDNSHFALRGEKIGKVNTVWVNFDVGGLNGVLWDEDVILVLASE